MDFRVIAMIAAFLTSTGFVPQIFKALETKEIKDVSMITLLFSGFGTFLWSVYGMYLGDVIIIWANLFTCASVCILIAMKVIYRQE